MHTLCVYVRTGQQAVKPLHDVLAFLFCFLLPVLEQLKEFLSTTKIDLPVDINDPYDLGLLLRHLRHHSNLLANIGNPRVKDQIITALQEDDDLTGKCLSLVMETITCPFITNRMNF